MMYETPGVAFSALEALYNEMKKDADEYAKRETAYETVMDKHHHQLQKLYFIGQTFKPIVQDVLPYIMICQLRKMIEDDPCMDEVIIRLRIHPDGNNIGTINRNLYDSTN